MFMLLCWVVATLHKPNQTVTSILVSYDSYRSVSVSATSALFQKL